MSEIDANYYAEAGFFTEDSQLVSSLDKPKHPSRTEKDDATLLSEGSSDDDDDGNEDDLVLEYTDGTLQENISCEEGQSSSASDNEISGLTNDKEIYKDSSPLLAKLVSFEAENENNPNEELRNTKSINNDNNPTDVVLKDDEIAKIAEVLSNTNMSDKHNIKEKAFINPGKTIATNADTENNIDLQPEGYNDDVQKLSSRSGSLSDSGSNTNDRPDENVTPELSLNDDLEWEEDYHLNGNFYQERKVSSQLKSVASDTEVTVDNKAIIKRASKNVDTDRQTGPEKKEIEIINNISKEEDLHKNAANDILESELATTKLKLLGKVANDVDQRHTPQKPTTSSSSGHKHKRKSRKMRHKIYLDDPDIHQRISDFSATLKKFASDIGNGTCLPKSQNKLHPVSRDDVFEVKPKRKGTKKRYTAPSTLKMMDRESDDNFESLRTSQSTGHLGPYDGHGKRGRNLISRIKGSSESSSSTEDEDEITNSKITRAGLANSKTNRQTALCSECGEQHSFDEDSNDESDQEICPDCGIPHNPFQHPPSPSAKDPPEPAKEENLPSIEGPHAVEELNNGVRYKMKYLGTTQVLTQHPVTKETRMQQAQEAYYRIKVPEGETQPCTQTEMIISLERLKVVNSEGKHEDVMMDHALRTVCFICDIGDIMVLMSRRLTTDLPDLKVEDGSSVSLANVMAEREKRTSKNICHIFRCDQAQLVSKAIGQAFNMAYRQFLKSNGISHDNVEEAEYCHVLESQKIVGQDLDLLADKNSSRDVVIQKKRNEPLGIMLLESGWGSMLPTVFIAHIANYSPAARLGGQISVGDHVLACNGASFVGLPLSECNQLLRSTRTSARVVLKLVACPPVVDVVVSRPDTKYQLGFSVQNGTICSLLRGGIAERGGVRVGHRIIEINGESVVAKSHQHIVDILAHTSGEISMKTLPVAMYRLMVGIDTPSHV